MVLLTNVATRRLHSSAALYRLWHPTVIPFNQKDKHRGSIWENPNESLQWIFWCSTETVCTCIQAEADEESFSLKRRPHKGSSILISLKRKADSAPRQESLYPPEVIEKIGNLAFVIDLWLLQGIWETKYKTSSNCLEEPVISESWINFCCLFVFSCISVCLSDWDMLKQVLVTHELKKRALPYSISRKHLL